MVWRIDWRSSVGMVGTVTKYMAGMMLIPLVVALIYGEDVWVFVASILIVGALGLAIERVKPDRNLGAQEALLFVSLAWLGAAVAAMVPYVLAGWGTDSVLAHPVNALFEAMSGVTATGATVMEEISFDRHSHAVLMWRQLTQWVGGMGIIVLMIAILPELAVNGAQLMRSEAPGPELQKLTPKIAQTARTLWMIYFGLTLVYVALLYALHLVGLAPNMDLYNAIAHGFTTISIAGFSPQADSIAAFSAAVQWVVIPFIVVSGINFALLWQVLKGEARVLFKNSEFRAYAGILASLIALAALFLYRGAAPVMELGGATAGSIENALRQGAFQVVSLMTSTGYATADYTQWDIHAQIVLLFGMFIGGCAGSTAGGIKVVRWVVVAKAMYRELFTSANPHAVRPVRLGKYVVDEDAVRGILVFTMLYLVIFAVSAVLITLDSARHGVHLSLLEGISASLATIGNIGPGFGALGPFGNYNFFPDTSKVWMTVLMWLGRLEIVPVLAMFITGYEEAR